MEKKPERTERTQKPVPAVSELLNDGSMLELLYDPEAKATTFAHWHKDSWEAVCSWKGSDHGTLVPYGARNNILVHKVVLFPEKPDEYDTLEGLVRDVRSYLHRYVDLTPRFEAVSAYYILLSWVYDSFNELPYLRVRGDFGSGKTRFLLIVGSLCYKPIFASGASSVAPLFHLLDRFRGTLIIDEADFRFSDEKTDIVKILNNGNVRGFPVLRCVVDAKKEFNPRAYQVFGPKLVGSRGDYDDRALESRFITEDMGTRPLRGDIPINLPDAYEDEARKLRNKLLMYRFRNHGRFKNALKGGATTAHPRLSQIFRPLLAVVDDEETVKEIESLIDSYQEELAVDRSLDVEAEVLGVIAELAREQEQGHLLLKDVAKRFVKRHGEDYDRRITSKWVGGIIRRKLRIRTVRSHGNYVIPVSEWPKVKQRWSKYQIDSFTAEGQERE